jgi:hypothetical protein
MIHKLYSIPTEKKNFDAENKYIKETETINGFSETILKRIFEKQEIKET